MPTVTSCSRFHSVIRTRLETALVSQIRQSVITTELEICPSEDSVSCFERDGRRNAHDDSRSRY